MDFVKTNYAFPFQGLVVREKTEEVSVAAKPALEELLEEEFNKVKACCMKKCF